MKTQFYTILTETYMLLTSNVCLKMRYQNDIIWMLMLLFFKIWKQLLLVGNFSEIISTINDFVRIGKNAKSSGCYCDFKCLSWDVKITSTGRRLLRLTPTSHHVFNIVTSNAFHSCDVKTASIEHNCDILELNFLNEFHAMNNFVTN